MDLHLQQPRSTTQRVFVESHEYLDHFTGIRGENLGELDRVIPGLVNIQKANWKMAIEIIEIVDLPSITQLYNDDFP